MHRALIEKTPTISLGSLIFHISTMNRILGSYFLAFTLILTPLTASAASVPVSLSTPLDSVTDPVAHSTYESYRAFSNAYSTPSVKGDSTAQLSRNLSIGSSGNEVLLLQNFLSQNHYLTVSPTSYFGSKTATAVRTLQAANGLDAVGNVGPKTRSIINSHLGSSGDTTNMGVHSNSATPTTSTTITTSAGAPTLSFVADHASVRSGGDIHLVWSAVNATSCTASGAWSGDVTTEGTTYLANIRSAKTYVLTCTNATASVSKSLSITVANQEVLPPATAPTLSFTPDVLSVVPGGSARLTWNSANASSCVASGAWSGPRDLTGSVATSGITGVQTYILTCTGTGGTASRSITITASGATHVPVTPSPVVTLTTSSSAITAGQSPTLSWSSTNATACTATGGWSGTKGIQGTQTISPTTTTVYSITCTNDGGTDSRSVTVNVSSPVVVLPSTPLPTLTLSADRTSIANGESAVLTWSSSNALSCAVSSTGWSAAEPLHGSVTVTNLTANQTYTMTCTGAGGTASKSITVTVAAPVTTQPTTTTPTPTPTVNNSALPQLLTASGALSGAQNATASITYNWNAKPMSSDYYMFVHVIDANGGIVFQDDHLVPSRTWSGSYTETRNVKIPAGAPVGTYRVTAGLFSTTNGYPKQTITAGPGVTKIGAEEEYLIGSVRVTAGTNLPFSPIDNPATWPGTPVQVPVPGAGDALGSTYTDDFHPAGMTLSFHDEFNGSSLNTNTWNTMYLWGDRFLSGNSEKQCYIQENVRQSGGSLIFDAKREDVICPKYNVVQNYTSGAITSSKSYVQTYGYFAIRTKLPAGKGFWPSFWLLPATGGWPPELDVFEVLGNDPSTIYTGIHFSDAVTANIGITNAEKVTDLSNGYHIIGVNWQPTFVAYYVDGVEVDRINKSLYNGPMYILANLAVGGGWPGDPDATTPFPSTMQTDWIRVYR